MEVRLMLLGGFLLLLLCFVPQAISDLESVKDPEVRAQVTLEGFFHYFWKRDQNHKSIEFFFSCAQIGGDGTPKVDQCSCYKPSSCVHCYRWWMAVALESVASYGMYMNTTNHSSVSDMLYNHSPYNAKWNATAACTYIDDFLWYGIAYLRVYEWLGDIKWLERSISLHDWAWEYGWDEPCGGFWWSSCDGRKFKDNIELVEAMHLAAKLAYLLPNDSRFLRDAERIWNWFFSYDNGKGLMSSTNLLSTGVVPENCCNSSSNSNAYKTCHNAQLHGTAYNNGLFLSASAYLYLSTGNLKYLNMGLRSVEAILANYTTKEGILVDEPRSYQSYISTCSVGSDPGGDWYSFSGIFMLHLGYFTELLVINETMPSDVLKKINQFTQKTSDSAWLKSAVWPPFDKSNVCQLGCVSGDISNSKYPKFHWWWGNKEDYQIIPPDPKLFFHINKLHCTSIGKNSEIWKGGVTTEDKCKKKCDKNTNCSKYNWIVYKLPTDAHNCWLWSYSRTSHLCNQTDFNWNVGFKRPIGQVSCAGRCGSTEPQKLDHGVCYCDTNCSKHLDCCLDYADHCRPQQPVSCKDYCDAPIAQPIPGGGYCWCNAGCDAWYTDNNSDGSCCPDYPKVCNDIIIPQCLDARTQGSALNLFIGHISVSRMMDKSQL